MYHLSPCIVALPNKRVQSDAAAPAGYRGENWLCNALRIEADFVKVAARLTRRAISEMVLSRAAARRSRDVASAYLLNGAEPERGASKPAASPHLGESAHLAPR